MIPFDKLTRKEIRSFYAWLSTLPSQKTAFMKNTYDQFDIQQKKLILLYEKYNNEKIK